MNIQEYIPINTNEKVDEIIKRIIIEKPNASIYFDVIQNIQKIKVQIYFKEKFEAIKNQLPNKKDKSKQEKKGKKQKTQKAILKEQRAKQRKEKRKSQKKEEYFEQKKSISFKSKGEIDRYFNNALAIFQKPCAIKLLDVSNMSNDLCEYFKQKKKEYEIKYKNTPKPKPTPPPTKPITRTQKTFVHIISTPIGGQNKRY